MADEQLKVFEIKLDGRWVSSLDPAVIGANYQSLVNMRYKDQYPQAVRGMTKLSSSVLTAPNVTSMFQYRKDSPQETHILAQSWDTSYSNSYVYDLTAVPPNSGDFSATPIYTEGTGAGTGRFSDAPAGLLAYCNQLQVCLWPGTEGRISGYINYNPDGSFKYTYTEEVQNSIQESGFTAILKRVTESLDTDTVALLHFNNDVLDASLGAPVWSNLGGGVTFSTTSKVFGSHAAVFDGTSYLVTPDSASFDFSGGNFAIESRVKITSMAAIRPIFYHYTDASNFLKFWVGTDGSLNGRVVEAGATFDISSPTGAISLNTWYHVELDESGDNYYLFVDGQIKAASSSSIRPVDYSASPYIGYDLSTYLIGGLDETRISKATRRTSQFELPLAEYSGTISYRTYVYFCYYLPLSGFKEYLKTVNTTAGVRRVEVWNGSDWASVSSLVDGTEVAGVPAAQTGTVTFADTSSVAKPRMIDGILSYWYRMSISDADDNIEVYAITPKAAMQPLKDIWDGIMRLIISYQLYISGTYYDYTTNVASQGYSATDASTYVDVGSFALTSAMLCGFNDRATAINIDMIGSNVNTTPNTIAGVEYWNGGAWTSVGVIQDGTSEGGISLAKSGIISWNPPDNTQEFKTELVKGVPLYYYRLTFSQVISASTYIQYVAGVPAALPILKYSYPFMAQNRLFLLDEVNGFRNKAICSAPGTSVVLNGDESRELYIGDAQKLTCGCGLYVQLGSNFYDVILFMKLNEVHMIVGNNSDNWTPLKISSSKGCPAPATLKTASISLPDVPGAKKEIALWQTNNDISMFDGRGPITISQDIEDWFDKSKSYSVDTARIGDSVGFFDRENNEYHWLFFSGTTSTEKTEFVYDLKRNRWFKVDRGTGKRLVLGVEVRSHLGSDYSYGILSDSSFARLEYGASFDGNAIAASLRTGDMVLPEGRMSLELNNRLLQLVHVSKNLTENSIACVVYSDGESTPRVSTTFDPSGSGRISKKSYSFEVSRTTFFSVGLSLSTSNENPGFEPLFIAEGYKKPNIWTEED